MATYQTQPMSGKQADDFIAAFDSAIGTETETDRDESQNPPAFTVTCFELNKGEVAKCKRLEAKVTGA